MLTDVRHPGQTKPLLEAARRRGIPVVGDFGNGVNWDLATHIDHLIVSEECAREVAGTTLPAEALPRLRQRADQVVGVTLGEQGYTCLEGDRLTHVPALAVEVVDTLEQLAADRSGPVERSAPADGGAPIDALELTDRSEPSSVASRSAKEAD